MGVVNQVLPHDELLPFVRSYVENLAAQSSPASMQVMKQEVYRHLTETLETAHDDSVQLMLESFGRPDFKEGVDAFLQKRKPRFERV